MLGPGGPHTAGRQPDGGGPSGSHTRALDNPNVGAETAEVVAGRGGHCEHLGGVRLETPHGGMSTQLCCSEPWTLAERGWALPTDTNGSRGREEVC